MSPFISWSLFVLHTLLAVVTAGHALLYKRDPRSAFGWIAICMMFPLAGPILYLLFGINRVRTRAKKYNLNSPFRITRPKTKQLAPQTGKQHLDRFHKLFKSSDAVSDCPIVPGNKLTILKNGEEAYPEMLKAILQAEETIYFTTYIFNPTGIGEEFIDAFATAQKRGVDVRIIIDGFGECYSKKKAARELQKRGINAVRFLPPRLFPPTIHINLRKHSKILTADSRVAFTGGMNIEDHHLVTAEKNKNPVQDMHFKLEGPVIRQMEQEFSEDWRFITGEKLTIDSTPISEQGDAYCRVVIDGPNENLDNLETVLISALSSATDHIFIMTPYFLPSREIIGALQGAALRGVKTLIILPEKNNLPMVHWATRNMLWTLLGRGVRIFYQPPPFAHTKLLTIDNQFSLIGSANWDTRSLRLNFELVVEVFDGLTAQELSAHFKSILSQSRETSLLELDSRSQFVRFRDAFCWLFSPYL